MTIPKILRAALVGSLCAVVLAACGTSTLGSAATTAAPATSLVTELPATETPAAVAGPHILKVATTADITTWDPVKSFSTEAFYMGQVYEQLLVINPPGSDKPFSPLLAESWESGSDGKEWTFHLRKGVTFHDGEPMNADAVVQSIQAAQDHGGASFIWAPLNKVEAVDNLTVKMTLKYAAPMDLIASSLYGAWIVSPKALAASKGDDKYFEKGIDAGTGPYTIDSYTAGSEVVLKAYDKYWGSQPYFGTVACEIASEDVQQQQMLEGGQVDIATRLPVDNLASFKDKPGFKVDIEPSFFNYVGFFNTTRKPLDDIKVRQALSYAMPYDDIIAVGAQGLGTQSRGPVPAGVWPWSADVNQYKTDVDKARQLLKDAGYEGGKGIPTLHLTYAAENPTEARFAPLIKDALANIGVTVEIQGILFNQQWDQAKADPVKAQDIFLLLYWPTYSDAGSDNLYSMFHSSEKPFFNLSYWKNTDYDKLIDDASALYVTDQKTAQDKYVQAMNLLVDQAPGVFLFDTKEALVIPDRIKGYQYNLNYPFVPFFFAQLSEAQ